MAAFNALNTMLVCIGCTANAAECVTDASQGGMTTIMHFKDFHDNKIEELGKSFHSPGEMIPNPQARVAGQPVNNSNPGVPVSLIAVTELKSACHCLRCRADIGRPQTLNMVTLANINRLKGHKEQEEKNVNPDAPDINFKNNPSWPKIVETMPDHLASVLGESEIPLACITHAEVEVLAADDDPDAWTAKTVCASVQEELVQRALHHNKTDPPVFSEHCPNDNIRVDEIIVDMTRDENCCNCVEKACSRQQDGHVCTC